jgi:hypothetical protein
MGALLFLYLETFLLPALPLVATGDEVMHLVHAVRIVHGQVPFRDFFIFVMPGTDLLYAGIFMLLGVHAWIAQGFVIFVGFAVTSLVVWVSHGIFRGATVLLPGLLFLVLDFHSAMDATHHWYSTLFVMAAVCALTNRRNIGRIFAAGALCGVATTFTQTQGMLSAIAIALYLVLISREENQENKVATQLAIFGLPFVIIVGGLLGYYLHKVGFHTLFYALGYFDAKFFNTEDANTFRAYFFQVPPLHKPGDLVAWTAYLFIHIVEPWAYLFCLVQLYQKKKNLEKRVWENLLLICLVGLALFAAVATGPTYHRLCMVAPPAIIAFVWLVGGASIVDRKIRVLLWSGAIVLVFYYPFRLQLHWRGYLSLPTGRTAFIDPVRYDQMKWLAQLTHAGEGCFGHPQATFILSLENPTPLDFVTPNEFTRPEQVASVIQALGDRQTPIVFFFPQLDEPRGRGDNLSPFRQYVHEHYHLAKVDSSGQVWVRN